MTNVKTDKGKATNGSKAMPEAITRAKPKEEPVQKEISKPTTLIKKVVTRNELIIRELYPDIDNRQGTTVRSDSQPPKAKSIKPIFLDPGAKAKANKQKIEDLKKQQEARANIVKATKGGAQNIMSGFIQKNQGFG